MRGCLLTNNMNGSPFPAGYSLQGLASSGRRLTRDAVPFSSGLGWAGCSHAYLGTAAAAGVGGTSGTAPASCAWSIPLLRIRPTNMAPSAVVTRISIPLSPARYSLTTTGLEVRVNAARVLQAALCTECAMEAGHTLPV